MFVFVLIPPVFPILLKYSLKINSLFFDPSCGGLAWFCLERGADLHTAQLMPLPLTVSCFSEIQIGFTFLVPAHPGSPRKGPLTGCVCSYLFTYAV